MAELDLVNHPSEPTPSSHTSDDDTPTLSRRRYDEVIASLTFMEQRRFIAASRHPELFECSTCDETLTLSSTATAPDLPGAGRTLGRLVYDPLSRRVEAAIKVLMASYVAWKEQGEAERLRHTMEAELYQRQMVSSRAQGRPMYEQLELILKRKELEDVCERSKLLSEEIKLVSERSKFESSELSRLESPNRSSSFSNEAAS